MVRNPEAGLQFVTQELLTRVSKGFSCLGDRRGSSKATPAFVYPTGLHGQPCSEVLLF